jgi:predicted NBD/HSP70 family sugar kinase
MNNILCIDIGGTRIKAAILKDNIDLLTLKNTKVEVISSLGWLNSSLPQIVSKLHPASIIQQSSNLSDHDYISISVPAQVINNGSEICGHYVEKRGFPREIKNVFEVISNCKVVIINDAICWLSGALNYYKLCEVKIEFPCLFISLGTSVGIGYAKEMEYIENLELSNHNHHFLHLSRASGQLIGNGGKVHACLGEKYFTFLKNDHKNWTYLDIKADFTNRILALLLDIKDKNIVSFIDLKTIFIGGGNANYVNSGILSSALEKNIFMLTPSNLQINPDLIPLLGQIKLL